MRDRDDEEGVRRITQETRYQKREPSELLAASDGDGQMPEGGELRSKVWVVRCVFDASEVGGLMKNDRRGEGCPLEKEKDLCENQSERVWMFGLLLPTINKARREILTKELIFPCL
ncbi:hypothetical protein Ahy_A04g020328 isoform E [Arachis hypogaea]|uniref:Uncharacterized protein n=1 Tax=Arachis hypogaea TaxID=3818 RepID=A0A445DHL3_ARAHY|nr:hypothetical protein Ahy_A04g020328 isoform E [Arachis hypogaea]